MHRIIRLVIEAEDLRKLYGDFPALDSVSLRVEEGEIFGLVGPNGAGKTTCLKILAGLLEPTSGRATVAGLDVSDPEMPRRIGFLPEEAALYENMAPLSYLRFFADLYGVPGGEAEKRIDTVLDSLDLSHRGRRIGDMSKGMKQKVSIARSLINDPEVLIYDEPTSGLDPLTTKEVHDFVRTLGGDGKSVVFSAHNLFHVENLCDRVGIMREGGIVAEGTVNELRDRFGGRSYVVHSTVELPGSVTEDGHHVVTAAGLVEVEELREEAKERGGEVSDVVVEEASLEELFLSILGNGR